MRRKPYLYDEMTEEMRKAIKMGWATTFISITAGVIAVTAALYVAINTIGQ